MQLLINPQTSGAAAQLLAFLGARARTGRNDMSYRIVPSGVCRLICSDGTVHEPPTRVEELAKLLDVVEAPKSASCASEPGADAPDGGSASQYPPSADIPTVVLFHSPQCPHCVRFMPQWEELKRRATDAIRCSTINVQQHPQLAQTAHVRGVPHLELHVKGTVHLYGGARTATALLEFIRSLLSERETASPATGEPPADEAGVRIVWFHAPWCGHCVRMRPAWQAAATDGRVRWDAIDCDAHPEIAAKEGVEGFPTIRAYVKGKLLMEHHGPRDTTSLREFATRALQALQK
jgi:thioredoxin-like negative regulator of GroEL